MTEQANTAWGLTVSRRFDSPSDADGAVGNLRESGFREDEIRVWQHKRVAVSANEDTMARFIEGMLAGGVIGGLGAFFISIAFNWSDGQRVTEENSVVAAIIGAVAGAVIVAIAVSIISHRFAFSHPHEVNREPASVVTVRVGDRETEAKQVFDKLG